MTLLQGRYRIWVIVIVCVVVFYFLLEFVLSLVVRHYANAAINDYPGLSGEIGSVKLHFIPGTYLVQNVKLRRKENGEQEILNLEELGARVYWKSLFTGAIEGDVWLESPHLIIWPPKKTAKKSQEADQKEANWQAQIRGLTPFKINTFEVKNGKVIYRDLNVKPAINLTIDDISLVAKNLTNRDQLKDAMFAETSVRARLFDSGRGELDMVFDPLAKQPTFKLESAIKHVDLTKLNDLLLAYGKFDIDKGTFFLFSEIAAKNGRFTAYVKPIFRDIDVVAWESRQHRNNKLLVIWKNIVGFVVDILKNEEKDQLAAKLKAEGSFKDPDLNIVDAVASLLRNGFIQALIPGYDTSITWTDVPEAQPQK